MITGLLFVSLFAGSEPPDTSASDSIPQAVLVDTGRIMPSPRRPVGMGIQRHRDSLPPNLTPFSVNSDPAISMVLALRLQDEWLGLRMGFGSGLDSGVSFLIGLDYHSRTDNLSFESAFRSRTESKGYRLSLVREKAYPLFPKTTFLLDLGVAYKWQKLHVDSTRTTETYSGKTISTWSDSRLSNHKMLVLGLGARRKIAPSFSLSGGIQFEPDWVEITYNSTGQNHQTGSQFHLNTPDWHLGLEWELSIKLSPKKQPFKN